MARVIAYARGDGAALAVHRTGTRYASAQVTTSSRTVAVDLWADGHGVLEIRQDGRLIAAYSWPAEGAPEPFRLASDR